MDHSKLLQWAQNQYMTDCTLELIDDENTINMSIHKIILMSSNAFFEQVLSPHDVLASNVLTSNVLTLIVPNVYITQELIYDMYNSVIIDYKNKHNLPIWRYIIEMIRCKHFLGIKNVVVPPHDLRVPESGYYLLLDLIKIFGTRNSALNYLLYNNLPKDYANKIGNIFTDEILSDFKELDTMKKEYK